MIRLTRFYAVLALSSILFVLSSVSAWAIGIGLYGQYKGSSAEMWVDYSDPYDIMADWWETTEAKRNTGGFGLLLDTCVSNHSFFNYRLQLGVGFGKLAIDGINYSGDVSLNEYHTYNSFGFGIIRNDLFRLWLGPQVGLGTAIGRFKFQGQPDGEYREYFASLGAILGINIHLSETISLGLSGGARKTLAISGTYAESNLYIAHDTLDGGMETFGDVALMFRYE